MIQSLAAKQIQRLGLFKSGCLNEDCITRVGPPRPLLPRRSQTIREHSDITSFCLERTSIESSAFRHRFVLTSVLFQIKSSFCLNRNQQCAYSLSCRFPRKQGYFLSFHSASLTSSQQAPQETEMMNPNILSDRKHEPLEHCLTANRVHIRRKPRGKTQKKPYQNRQSQTWSLPAIRMRAELMELASNKGLECPSALHFR